MAEKISYEYGDMTIQVFLHLWENGCLNLSPGFQRKSVWGISDRKKLIETILQGAPIPSIFLYKREENNKPVYDVIDGKQRLESIFMFLRAKHFKKRGFELRFQFSGSDGLEWIDWKTLEKMRYAGRFLESKIQTVEVQGELSDIINLFVKINSTGKALTSAEKRHARFFNSVMLQEAHKLARKYNEYLVHQEIISSTKHARMKDVELISELLASISSGGPIHRKESVDKIVGNEHIDKRQLNKDIRDVISIFNIMKKLFPNLRETRFKNTAEFYTLFLVIWEMKNSNLILNDRTLNSTAQNILIAFSNAVDEVREKQKKLKFDQKKLNQLCVNYLSSVQMQTDSLSQRKIRAEIVKGLFRGLFEKKDINRNFSVEQRRFAWNSDQHKKCSLCGKTLSWVNFQLDHVIPHSKKGKTIIDNAALICASCNASKGAR